jgi:hypothetical protein
MVSRAPDITERTQIDLSGRLSTYYDLNGNAFDLAIGGMPFIMAVTDNTPYKRQTAEFRAQRVDQMRDPGEHTLAGSGYWTRSQSSWHYGEGINFTEPMEGNDNEVRFRYKNSYGIDPWTPGQITLLKKTTLAQAFRGKCDVRTAEISSASTIVATDLAPVVSTTAAATAATSATTITVASTASIVVGYVINGSNITAGTTVSTIGTGTITISAGTTGTIANGAALTFHPVNAIYKITTGSTSTAFITYAQLGYKEVKSITSDGAYVYVSTATNIYDINLSTGTVHDSYTINTTNASTVVLKYVKSRVMAGITRTDGTCAVYELTFPNKGAGASINISTLTAVNGSTNMPVGWTWTTVGEAIGAIYVGGSLGEHSALYKLSVDNTGALGTILTSAILPRGEKLLSVYGYLGTYIMMGTNKGARIAQTDVNGDITYGPLVFHNENGVYDFEARDSYVWCANTNGVNTNSGTMRINLAQPITLSGYAQPISTGVYARATDVFADGITGTVHSVRIFDSPSRVVFAIEGSGVWIEHATDLVESGVISGGKIRYDTMENKAWKRIRIRSVGDIAGGDIEIYKINPTSDSIIYTILEGNSTAADIDLANSYPGIAPDASFKLELYRNTTTATTGPVVVGVAVKALPTPTRARVIQIPLFCYDKETDKTGNIIGYEGYAKERLYALETIEAQGDTVIMQDFNAGGDPLEVLIDQVTFTRSTPSNRNYTGFGGIIQVVARTVV